MTDILVCDQLACGYGDSAVVRDVTLTLAPGEIVAVNGPNGAGKTTLLLTIAGFLSPLAGTVQFEGAAVAARQPARANRKGLVLVPDDRSLFSQMTVRENLRLSGRGTDATLGEIVDLFPGLGPRLDFRAGLLSGGEQQMLALGRALMRRPRLLLIDEMSMGLAPIIVESLLPVLRRVCEEQGTAVVLVEQHLHISARVADRVLVIAHGDVVYQGTAAEADRDRIVVEAAYLGLSPAGR